MILLFSCIAVSAAATFPDVTTHWATKQIEYMAGKKILNGFEDGTFRPDEPVTRAQFIKMLNETFGLTARTSINYSDVKEGDWFYDYVVEAEAQGYLLNYGTSLNPNGQLSRQEAATLIARYLDLDPANKAPSSTYPDYSSIKTAYRDYVLMATAEGLFNGYGEDGTFRPDAILTRSQALAVLYRAAGSIYTTSRSGLEADANDKNAVITNSGVTISNAKVDGRLLISEGVSGDTVTLSGCTADELIYRGTASLVLSDCDIEKLTVDSSVNGFTASVSLLSNSEIKETVLETAAEISLASRTKLDTLTVNENAKNSSVSGSGTLNEVKVNAKGFTAEKLPAKYTIAKNLTATFAGTSYSGNSTSSSSSGFSVAPTTYATTSNCYLTGTTTATGKIYYYFTTASVAPTAATFDSLYAAAAVKNNYSVTANRSQDVNIGLTSAVSAYPYVAVMFENSAGTHSQPQLIVNKASSGFSVAPTASVSGTTRYLSYTPAVTGTVYYYYTNSGNALTVSSFTSGYNSASARGTLSATAGQSATNPTLAVASTSTYTHLAVLLLDSATEYQPVVITLSGTTQSTAGGFSVAPTAVLNGTSVLLAFTPSVSGTVEYYFSASKTVPTGTQFDTYKLQMGSYSGTQIVTAGMPYALNAGTQGVHYIYPYIVLRIKTTSTTYQPVVIEIGAISGGTSGNVNLTNTSFTAAPVVSIVNGQYYLTLPTSSTVYFYLTNSDTVSSSTVFMNRYQSATTNIVAKLGGVLSGSTYAQATGIASSSGGGYDYIALMAVTGTYQFTPVVIPLPKASSSGTTAGTGFLTDPIYSMHMAGTHQIDVLTEKNGTVLYYYTNLEDTSEADTIIPQILFGASDPALLCGQASVIAGVGTTIAVHSSEVPKYVVLIFMDQNKQRYTPVRISANILGTTSTSSNGFQGNAQKVTTNNGVPTLSYNSFITGQIYYYFTNNNIAPITPIDFFEVYTTTNMKNLRGTAKINTGISTVALSTPYGANAYSYVVILAREEGYDAGGYYRPFTLQVNATGSSLLGNIGFSGTPSLSGNMLYFTPLSTGTLYYSFTGSNSAEDWTNQMANIRMYSQMVNPNVTVTPVTLSSTYVGTYGGSYKSVTSTMLQSTSIIANAQAASQYLVIWMATPTNMSQPVFLPLSGTTVPGAGSTTVSTTGFTVTPTYNSATGYITYTPGVAGTIKVLYTNSNEDLSTAIDFNNLYNTFSNDPVLRAFCNTSYSNANTSGYLSVNSTVKYVWVLLTASNGTAYKPVRVQISA